MSPRAQSTHTAGERATPTSGQTGFSDEPVAFTPGPTVTVTEPSFVPPPPTLPTFVQGNSNDGQNTSQAKMASETNPVPDARRTLPAAANAPTASTPAFLNIGMRVRALYKFEPTTEGDLAFEKGDIITIVGREMGSDLWNGQLNGHTGVIPSNYMEPVPEPSASQSPPLSHPLPSGSLPGALSTSPGTIVQQAPIPSPYTMAHYSRGTTQGASAQMRTQAQTPQSVSMHSPGTQLYSQSQPPRPVPYLSPQTYPGFQSPGQASGQYYSAFSTPATHYSTNMSKPTTPATVVGGRTTARKCSFVAKDPFRPRPQSQAHKTDKDMSDNLTFDDIPIAGTLAASNPAWTSSTPHYGSGSQSQNAPNPSQSVTTGWYNATPSGDQGSQSQTPVKPPQSMTPGWYNARPSGDQGSQSYPTAPPTGTQSPAPYNPCSSSYPSYNSQHSESQPTTGPRTQYPISSPYPIYEVPFRRPSIPTLPRPSIPILPRPSIPTLPRPSIPILPRPSSQLPYGSRPLSPWPDEVPPWNTPVPQEAVAVSYDSYRPHYSPPLGTYQPFDPIHSPFPKPSNNYTGDLPVIENFPSAWARIKRFLRHPFSFSRCCKNTFGPKSEKVASENGYSEIAVKFIVGTLPGQIYLHILLRMPSLYFSRVARIFEEADLTLPELKKMALETVSEGRNYELDSPWHHLDANDVPPQYRKLKLTWENFIDSVTREWKTFNIIEVLLMSAILTILQIDAAAADPVSRYAALFSLTCALMSLLFGCMYIIRFSSMRKTYKAAEWALEAQNTKSIWWNVWILLAMPVIWLTWSIILYILCIMSFIWRAGSPDAPPPAPLSHQGLLAIRVIITIVLGVGFVYGALIISTFRHYGDAMDKAWKQRIERWLIEKGPTMYSPQQQPNSPNMYQPQNPSFSPWGYQPQHNPRGGGSPSLDYRSLDADPRGKQTASSSFLDLQWSSGYQPQSPTSPFIPPLALSPLPPPKTLSYTDLGYNDYTSNAEGKSSSVTSNSIVPPTHYAPYYQNLAEPQTQTRSNTPDSADSTVNLTEANVFHNALSHLYRTPSTSSGHSAIHNGPGYPTNYPLPSPSQVTVASNDIPPSPRLITSPAQPLTPSLPGSAYGGEDADHQSVHVRFRSPLVSAQGSNSPWGSSSGASLRSERSDDNLDPTKPANSPHAGRSKRPDSASYESLELKKGDPASPS